MLDNPEKRLIHVIKKKNNLHEGIFANINNDLNESISIDSPQMIKMAYAYARRTAAAGLYLQGIFTYEDYCHASMMFRVYQRVTGHTVEFQEEAASQAFEYIYSYDKRLDRKFLISLTSLVELQGHGLLQPTHQVRYELFVENLKAAFEQSSSIFTPQKETLGSKLINQLGYEDASIVLYGMVSSRFDTNDTYKMVSQMGQFIREEFDAASRGNAYSIAFVNKLCHDSSWYEGAMGEQAEFPIDNPGGPQQTILGIIIPMIHENAELAVKLRCHIVEMIYEDYEVLKSELMNTPRSALFSSESLRKRRERLTYLFQNKLVSAD